MGKRSFTECEYCGCRVKRSNYLKHKRKVHPKELSEDEMEALTALKRSGRSTYRTFWERWSGLPEEAIDAVKELRATTIEEHMEKSALLQWMKKSLFGDPYWIRPITRIADHKYNTWLNRLNKVEDENPQWVRDLDSGMPSYYCILGVRRKPSRKELEEHYRMKVENASSYSRETLDEALETLSHRRSEREYRSLLNIINHLNRGLNKTERKAMIREHDSWVKHENALMIMHHISRGHSGWKEIFRLGAPTFHEIAGIDGWKRERADEKKIREAVESRKEAHPEAGELLDRIHAIFGNTIFRWEYELLTEFLEANMKEGLMETEKRRREVWVDWHDKYDILIYLLDENDPYDEVGRWSETMREHHDWQNYLPPGSPSFYEILGIPGNEIPPKRDDMDSFLRSRYRECDRTAEVNLAYTVLKNRKLRKNYDWMLKKHGVLRRLYEILITGAEEAIEREEEEKMLEDMADEMMGKWVRGKIEKGQ